MFVQRYAQLRQLAEAENDMPWKWMLTYHRFRNRIGLKLSKTEIYEGLDEMEKMALRGNWPIELLITQHYRQFERFNNKEIEIEQQYAYILEEFDQMKDIGIEDFKPFDIADLMFHSGKFMFDLEDFEHAQQFLSIGEQHANVFQTRHHVFILTLNYLQSISQNHGDLEKAFGYAQRINQVVDTIQTHFQGTADLCRFWKGLSSIDMAYILIQQGKYTDGERVADEGYLKARAANDGRDIYQIGEFEALMPLIDLKIKLSKYEEAANLIQRAEKVWATVGPSDNNYFKPIKLYQSKAKLAEIKSDFAASVRYRRMFDALEDSLKRRTDVRSLDKIKKRLEAQRYSAKIKEIESDKAAQGMMALVVLLLLSCLGGLLYYRLYYKKKQAQKELEAAKRELEAYIQHFREKSDLAENLRQEIKQLSSNSDRSEHLQNLLQSTILTEEDWKQFRIQFEKIYPQFIATQRSTYPEITQAELRYLVLEQLQLNTTEMARMLGVSDGSIRQTRSRLRKKMAMAVPFNDL